MILNLKDKRGNSLEGLPEIIVVSFFIIVIIGLFAYCFNYITTVLNIDQVVGNVNLGNVTSATIGQINTAMLDKLDLIGMMILFGMVLAMLVNAYFTRENYPKLFIIIDLILIFIVYILAVYVSNAYELIIGTDQISSIFVNNMSGASKFILKLPLISVVVGILIMIITYSNIPKTREETIFVGRS